MATNSKVVIQRGAVVVQRVEVLFVLWYLKDLSQTILLIEVCTDILRMERHRRRSLFTNLHVVLWTRLLALSIVSFRRFMN